MHLAQAHAVRRGDVCDCRHGVDGACRVSRDLSRNCRCWSARGSANPWWTVAAGVGIVVGVAYTWRALQKAFFADRRPTAEDHPRTGWDDLGAITWPEMAGSSLLMRRP